MLTNARRLATPLVAALLCLSTACTTLTPVMATPERIRADVRPGDTVRVLTADGASHRVQVGALGETSLSGDAAGSHIEVPFRDIRQIDVEHVSAGKTTALVAGVVVLGAVAIATGGGSHSPGYTR
jgi:hypothetical protein